MIVGDDLAYLIVDAALSSLYRFRADGQQVTLIKRDLQYHRGDHSVWRLREINRSFRRASNKVLWFNVSIQQLKDVDDIFALLQITPQASELVRNLSFELRWPHPFEPEFEEMHKSGLDYADWVYDKIKRDFKAKSARWPDLYSFTYPCGPVVTNIPTNQPGPTESMQRIEALIVKMPFLNTFHYRSILLPLTQRACEHLRDCDSLQLISLGAQGEMMSVKYPFTPLEILFNRQSALKVAALSLHLSPAPRHLVGFDHLEKSKVDSVMDKLEIEPVDRFQRFGKDKPSAPFWAKVPDAVILPNLNQWLASASMDGVPYCDQPIVAVVRSLIAAQDQIGLLVLSTTCRWLCRIPNIIWLWLKIQVSRYYRAAERREIPSHVWDEPWVCAARALGSACESVSQRLHPSDRKLMCSDVPLLVEESAAMQIYGPYLQDRTLQRKIVDTWNGLVASGHSLTEKDIRPEIPLPSGPTSGPILPSFEPDLRMELVIKKTQPAFELKFQPWQGHDDKIRMAEDF